MRNLRLNIYTIDDTLNQKMHFAFISEKLRTPHQVWNMISQSHRWFQFCPSSPWSSCCTPVEGGKMNEYFFCADNANQIHTWSIWQYEIKSKRTLFRSGVKWFIQSPTIPFLMNWPLPCLLHGSRTMYFVKSFIFQISLTNLEPLRSMSWTSGSCQTSCARSVS